MGMHDPVSFQQQMFAFMNSNPAAAMNMRGYLLPQQQQQQQQQQQHQQAMMNAAAGHPALAMMGHNLNPPNNSQEGENV